MSIDPIVAVIVVVIAIVALAGIGQMLTKRADEQAKRKAEHEKRQEEAREREERRQREQWVRDEAARKEQESAAEAAHEQKLLADIEKEHAHAAFVKMHDDLIAAIRAYAKEGCDAEFQRRFGVTRPPKAATPQDDAEVQDFLRDNYASLRDAALADTTESFIRAEVARRIGQLEAQASAADDDGNAPETAKEPEGGTVAEKDADDEAAAESGAGEALNRPSSEQEAEAGDEIGGETEVEAEPEGQPDVEPDSEPAEGEGEDEPKADAETEAEAKADAEAGTDAEPESATAESRESGDAPDAPREHPEEARNVADTALLHADIEREVREYLDEDSLRTYLLAAISARFDPSGKPIGELPWPAFTTMSPLGYGELSLVKGAPTYAQDSYREFAWKKFHLGKRAEKPTRGEYSWPASHELGDHDAGTSLETPCGTFSIRTATGPQPLREFDRCSWIRHDLEYQGLLLAPDEQHSLLLNLEGLRKGERIELAFDGASGSGSAEDGDGFLQEVGDTAYSINAVGQVGEAYVGISVSNPQAASPGEAPYELAERTGRGFVFRMTADARRHDDDTYPQFLQANIAWCQPPSPNPGRVVRHVTK